MIVSTLWIGASFSPVERLSAKSFIANGHEYHLYAYNKIAGVPKGVVLRDAREILPADQIFAYKSGLGAGSVSAFSNIFRYKLLYDRGGCWVDTDVVCLRRFKFDTDHVFGAERTIGGGEQVASCVMVTPPRNRFADLCLSKCMNKDRDAIVWGEIGPQLVTAVVDELALNDYVLPCSAFCPSDWWRAPEEIVGPEGRLVDTSQSYAVHLWNEMWRRHGLRKNDTHHPDSLYSTLSHHYAHRVGC